MSKTAKSHIYLDLDRTLFNTSLAGRAAWIAAQELYGLDAEKLQAEEANFHGYAGEQYFYRFFDHLASHGVEPVRAAEELRSVLSEQDFFYPDARELVLHLKLRDIKPTILSFGDPAYQGFKYRLIPELEHIPFICVSEPKGPYVAKHGHVKAYIIDDKPLVDVPDECIAIQLVREQAEPMVQDGRHYVINDLRLAKGLLT